MMSKRHLSTGLPSFDNFIGGLVPGEFLLFLVSDPGHIRPILSAVAASAGAARTPLLYLSIRKGLADALSVHPRLRTLSFEGIRPLTAAGAVRKAGARSVRRGFIIPDDLSWWKEHLGGERRTTDLTLDLARLAERRRSVLICSAVRSAFSPECLAQLKDAASVCLDVVSHADESYCMLISRKGRYLPGSRLPLRLRKTDLMKTPSPAGEAGQENAPEQQKLPGDAFPFHTEIGAEKSFQSAPEAFVLFDLDGDFREANARMLELLGYSADELKILRPQQLVEERFRLVKFLRQLKRKQRGTVPLTVRGRNGKTFPAEFIAVRLSGSLYLGALTDLSARNRELGVLARKEEELRLLLDNLPLAVAAVSGGRVELANRAFATLFATGGSEAAEGQPVREFIGGDGVRKYQRILREGSPPNGSRQVEIACRKPDGGTMHCRTTVQRTSLGGKAVELLLFQDVSGEKKAIETLASSEERFRTLVESSPQPVAVLDEGRIGYVNQAFVKMFGSGEAEKFLGEDISSIADEEAREGVRSALRKQASSRSAGAPLRFHAAPKNGENVECELTLTEHPGKGTGRRLAFIRDVTGEEAAKRDLQHRLDEIELLDRLVPELPAVVHLDKLQQAIVVRITEALGWSGGAIYVRGRQPGILTLAYHRRMPQAVAEKIPSLDSSSGIGGYLSKTQESHVFAVDRYPSYLPYRSVFRESGLAEICFVPLLSGEKLVGALVLWSLKGSEAAGRPAGFLTALGRQVGSSLANALAYETMREAMEKGAALIESSADVLYTAAPSGMIIGINAAAERLTGYQPKEFLRTPSLWLKLVHPDDKKILLERIAGTRKSGERSTAEYRILPRGKAEYRWVRDTIHVQSSGAGMTVLGTVADITALRTAVEVSRTDAALKAGVLASLQEGVAVLDRNLRVVQWNPMMAAMTGISEEAALGREIQKVLPGSNPEEVVRLIRRALTGELVNTSELCPAPVGDKPHRYLWARCSPLRNAEGETDGVVCLVADVSEQKNLESEMRESEQVLRNVIDTMGDILVITDLRGMILQVNRAFQHVLGYTRADAVRHEFPYPWLLEEEMGRFVLWIANLRERNWLHDFDMTWRTKDGRLIPMSLSTTLLRNSLGEPIAMLNIARDITDRVRLTRDLESRNRQIEMINRIISKANQTMEFDEIFTAIAKEIRGLVPADLISLVIPESDGTSVNVHTLTGKQVFWKGKAPEAKHPVASRAMAGRAPVIVSDLNAEPDLRSPDALHKDLRSQISVPIRVEEVILGALDVGSREPHTFSDDTVAMLGPIAQQIGSIIDRVRLFNQVSEDAAYIHNLLDSIDSIVYTVDRQLRIREVNKAWFDFIREFGGGAERNFQGMPLYDVLPDERLKITYQNVIDQVLDGTMRIFSQEFVHHTPSGERTYQLTISPMVIERRVTGLVFTHADISALKRTEAELKNNNEQLLALNEISTLISISLDLDETLRATIPLLINTIGAGAAVVYLNDPESQQLRCAFHLGFPVPLPESAFRLLPSESATGEAVNLKAPLYIEGAASRDPRILTANREFLHEIGLDAMAAIPLLSKDNVLGAIDIFYPSPHKFSPQERQILTLVGNQLGAALENTQLYAQLRAQVERLTVLYELSEQLTSTLDTEEIFRLASEHLGRLVPFARFLIEFTDGVHNTITPMFCIRSQNGSAVPEPVAHQPADLVDASPQGLVVGTKRAQWSGDGRSVYIPMLSKGTILGIMTIDMGEGAAYTEAHARLFESIANLTAIALEKGKLYEETLQKSTEIERRNKELDDFTYVVSHDLKEPLISVEGFSKILQADYGGTIQAEGKDYLDSIVGATARMKGLIDDLLLLSRVSRPSESYRQVSVREILNEILTDMEFTVRQRGVKVVIPDNLPEVFGNATQVGIVFRNLIGNAVKFNTSPNPLVEIGFQNQENNSYLFWVKDNGIGIEKDFHEKIFIIFQRLHRREEYEGSGAGLAIVKKIVELHKGKIWVESEPGAGSTFFFTLPQTSTT